MTDRFAGATPGEWVADDKGVIAPGKGPRGNKRRVAIAETPYRWTEDEFRANRVLLAAAPALLSALREAREALEIPLLFHDGAQWTEEKAARWEHLNGTREATTKVMWDTLRCVILDIDKLLNREPT